MAEGTGEDCHRFPRLAEEAQAEIYRAHLRHSITGMYLNCFTGVSYLEQFWANADKVNQMLSVIKTQVEKRGCRE